MRGDGSDGRRGGGGRVDASDLDTLHDPDAPLDPPLDPPLGQPLGVADDEWDDDWTEDELDADPDDPDDAALLEEDALYDDGYDDDGYEDDGYGGAPVARIHPRPAQELDGVAYDDDPEAYDPEAYDPEDDEAGPYATVPAAAAAAGYDDEYDDEYADGYDDEYAQGYDDGAAVAASWPAPAIEPEPTPVAAMAGARSPGGPTIWAPGTAPGAWVPLGRPGFGNPLPSPDELRRSRTRRRNLSVFSLAGLTNVLLLAYAVTAALLAGFTAALARRRGALDQVAGEAQRADALAGSSYLVSVTTWGVVGLLVATVVASMIWTAVASHNHRMLSGGATPTGVMAVLPWAVPLANLVLPLRAVSEVAAGPTGRRAPPSVTLRWWIAWVASMLTVGYAVFAAATTSDGDQADAITRLTLAAVLATVCFLYCFSQASVLFRHVARLQHELAVELD